MWVRFIALLPFTILYWISDIHYFLIYYVFAYRKKLVRKNLIYSFPNKSAKELKKIEKEFYRHFTDLLFEGLKLSGMNEKQVNKHVKFAGYEQLQSLIDEGKSVMLYSSHYCNWEWQSALSIYFSTDKSLYQIYKRQSNDSVDRLIAGIRTKFGGVNIEMKSLLREMVRMKNKGQNGIFALLSDQSPGRSSIHYHTQFLNQNTAVITGTEQISKKFDYPVFYTRMNKIKRGYYTCEYIPITLSPKELDDFEISEKYMRLLEEDIINDPAYWLWSHNRWKITRNN